MVARISGTECAPSRVGGAVGSPSWACLSRPTSEVRPRSITERARRPRTVEAQIAVKRLSAKGSQAAGRKRKG